MGRRRVRRSSPATEGGRRPSVVAGVRAFDQGRWSSRRKMEVVLRLLKGEDIEFVSRQLKVTAARLAQWREAFLAAGMAGLQSREPDDRDLEVRRLKAKIGDLTMDNELLLEKIHELERSNPPAWRRSSR